MSNPSSAVPRSAWYNKICCFVLFFMAASASFSGYYSQCHFHEVGLSGGWSTIRFEAMVDGTANRPFVYRQMLPDFANWLDSATSQSVKGRLYTHQRKAPDAYIDAIATSPTAQNPVYFFRYLVIYALTFLFALLAVYAMHLVCLALHMSAPAAVFAPVVVILMLPYFMMSNRNSGYFYDYPELAFLALAVWVVLKFDWWWVIPVAALGTWNKESFLLVMPTLYPFIRRTRSRLHALLAVAVLSAVCVAVYFPIHQRFAHNPGGTVEFHWSQQLAWILNTKDMVIGSQQTYGIRLLKVFSILPIALLVWTVVRAWKKLPLAIRRHAQIATVINVPLYFAFCAPGELRDLSLLYVALLAVIAVNLNDWITRAVPIQLAWQPAEELAPSETANAL